MWWLTARLQTVQQLSFTFPHSSIAWSESYKWSDSSCALQSARSATFIVSECLFPIRSHGNIRPRQASLPQGSRQRGSSRLCLPQPDLSLTITKWVTVLSRVSAHAPQFSFSPSPYFLSDLIGNMRFGLVNLHNTVQWIMLISVLSFSKLCWD